MNIPSVLLSLVVVAGAVLHAVGHSFEYTTECSLKSSLMFKLGYKDGSHNVAVSVRNPGVAGQKWDVLIQRDGKKAFKGTKTTNANGGFLQRVRAPGDVVGLFYLYATAQDTGEICTAAKFIE